MQNGISQRQPNPRVDRITYLAAAFGHLAKAKCHNVVLPGFFERVHVLALVAQDLA